MARPLLNALWVSLLEPEEIAWYVVPGNPAEPLGSFKLHYIALNKVFLLNK